MTKKLLLCLTVLSACLFATGQEIKLSGSKFKSGDTVIAQVERKKQSFDLVNAGQKVLIHCEARRFTPKLYKTPANSSGVSWFVFYIPELSDSVQLNYSNLDDEVSVPLFGPKEETFAKLYNKKNFLNADGSLNRQALEEFRKKYAENFSAQYRQEEEHEAVCTQSMKTVLPRDQSKEVVIKELKRDIQPGKPSLIEYEISQGEVVIGKVEVKGPPKVLEDETAEIEYHAGIMSLDKGDGISYYNFINSEGCVMSMYITPEKNLFTYKDWLRTPVSRIPGKKGLDKRIDFIQVLAEYLVKKGYL